MSVMLPCLLLLLLLVSFSSPAPRLSVRSFWLVSVQPLCGVPVAPSDVGTGAPPQKERGSASAEQNGVCLQLKEGHSCCPGKTGFSQH